MATCGKSQGTERLYQENIYLKEVPIAPLDNPFNPIALLGRRRDQRGSHVENFDKKVWKNELVRGSVQEITASMNVSGPIKYIPFWCLDRLLGLYVQARYYEPDKIIGHWMPEVPEQIRVEDNPPQYRRTRRFYWIAEVLLLKRFPRYGYLWNLILAQVTELPLRAVDSLGRKLDRRAASVEPARR
jgi:hypothetical protein